MPIICTIQKSPMGDLGGLPTASGGLTDEGGNPAYPNRFQSPLIPLPDKSGQVF